MRQAFFGFLLFPLFLTPSFQTLFSQSTSHASLIEEWILSSPFTEEIQRHTLKRIPSHSFTLPPSLLQSLLSLFSRKKHPHEETQKRFEKAFISTYQPFFTFINTRDIHTPLSFLSHYKTEVVALQERMHALEKELSTHPSSTRTIIQKVHTHLLKKIKKVELHLDPTWKAFFYRHLYALGAITALTLTGATLFYFKNALPFPPNHTEAEKKKTSLNNTGLTLTTTHNTPPSNPLTRGLKWAANEGTLFIKALFAEKDPTYKLEIAASKGDQARITALLDEDGPTPSMVKKALYLAAAGGYPAIVDQLITWHEQHNHPISNEVREEIVLYAAHRGHQELTLNLIHRYPDTLAHALQCAAVGGQAELIIALLDKDGPTGNQVTPSMIKEALYKASFGGHQAIVDQLITWHEQHNHPISNEVREEIVLSAAHRGHHELTFYLLQRYPDTLARALRSAAYGGHQALIHALLEEQGPTDNQVTPTMIDEALIQAAAGGHQAILDNLILWYEQHSHVLSNEALNNTVRWAAQKGHHALTFNLLHRYPHTLARALMSAAYGGHQALIHALLEEQGPTGNQVTPSIVEEALYEASFGGHQAIVDQLITWYEQHDYPLNDEVIEETVGWAAQKGHQELTLNLVHRYPDTLAHALKCAAYGGQPGLITALLDEDGPTGNQVTPSIVEEALYEASFGGHQAIVDQLITWYEQHNHSISDNVIEKIVFHAAYRGNQDLTFYLLHRYPYTLRRALEYAAYGEHQELITALLDEQGPTGNQVTPETVKNTLYNAVFYGHQAIINQLIAWYEQHNYPLSNEVIEGTVEEASNNDHQDLTSNLLQRYPDILASVLQSAAWKEELEHIQALLDENKGRSGRQYVICSIIEKALYNAAKRGYQPIIDNLIAWYEQHNYPLSNEVIEGTVGWAAYKDHQELTLNLIHRYPDTLANALQCAAYGGQQDLITALLDEQGPTGNQVTPTMIEEALYNAADSGYQAILDNLILWYEQHSHVLSNEIIEETVGWAANKGHHELTFYLLQRYPDTLARALRSAAYGGQHELVTALLDKQGPTGQHVTPEMIQQALHEAHQNNHADIIQLLTN